MSSNSPELEPKAETSVTVSEVKPGYKTTEFWMSTAALICGVLLSSGVIGESGLAAQIVGGIMSTLAALGYTASRGKAKA